MSRSLACKACRADERVTVSCEDHVTNCLFPADHQRIPQMTFLALLGEDGFVRLQLVGDSVSTFLGIQPGSPVTIQW